MLLLHTLILAVACLATLSGAVPQSFSARLPNVNPQDSALLLAADSSGNLFVIATSRKTPAITNIHVVKTDSAGSFLASFDFGGSGIDTPRAAAVDPQGNLIVVGTTESPDFPMVSPLLTSGGGFATKVDAQLTTILFSTRLGTVGGGLITDGASAAAVDKVGNIYITGSTKSGFPTTVGAVQSNAPVLGQDGALEHGFVMELSASGDRVVFSTYFSGGGFICATSSNPCEVSVPKSQSPPSIATTPSAITVNSDGAIVIAGITNSSSIPVSSGAYATQCLCTNQSSVAFIARLSPGGKTLEWGTYVPPAATTVEAHSIEGIILDGITSLALDSSGNIVFGGTSVSTFPISANALQATFPSPPGAIYAGYVAKLDATGSKLLFSSWLGGAASNLTSSGPAALAVDTSGIIWVTGGAAPYSVPAPANTAILGESYIAGISNDGSSVVSLFTAPDNATGQAIQATSSGIASLGTSGTLLISSPAAGPSLLGFAASPEFSASSAVAPRELISLYGIGIGPPTAHAATTTDNVISTSLAGVQLLFDGVPAALLYAGPTQINAIVPTATAARETTTISIITPGGTVTGPTVAVQATRPQVFGSINGIATALNQDGTLNSLTNPATKGSIVAIWLTGGGARSNTPDNMIATALRGNPYPVSILASDPGIPFPTPTSLEVLYAGDAPGQPSGVIQVNFRLPSWAKNLYTVQIGAAATAFSIYVQ